MNTKTALRSLPRILISLALFAAVALAREPKVRMYGTGIFSPNQEIQLSYGASAGSLNFSLEKIKDPLALLSKNPEQPDLNKVEGTVIKKWQRYNKSEVYGDEKLGRLPSGVYKFSIRAGNDRTSALLLVTNLGLLVKRSQTESLAFTADRTTGVAKISKVWSLGKTNQKNRNNISEPTTTDAAGLAHFYKTNAEAGQGIFLANNNDDWAISNSNWNSYALEKTKGYIYTDRPVYRPGQHVDFKGTFRDAKTLAAIQAKEINFSISDSNGREIFKSKTTTNNFGSFGAGLNLDDEPALGLYNINVQYDGEEFSQSFYVEAYQKPEYAVTVTSNKTKVVQGDTVKLLVEAKYLFGGAVGGAKVNYYVTKAPYYAYTWDDETYVFTDEENNRDYGADLVVQEQAVLDKNGKLEIELPISKDENAVSYRVQAEVTDEARRAVAGNTQIVAYPASINVNISKTAWVYNVGEAVEARVATTDLEDVPVAVPRVVVELVRQNWILKNDAWEQQEKIVDKKIVSTDSTGKTSLNLKAVAPGGYSLRARSADAKGRISESNTFVWVVGTDRNGWYWNYSDADIVLDKKTYEVGDTVTAIIGSPKVGADVLLTLEADGIKKTEVLHSQASSLVYTFKVGTDMQPNVFLTASIMGNNRLYTQEKTVRVPVTDTAININIGSGKEKYKPQETGTLNIQVTDANGKGVPAELGLSVVDEAIYLLRKDSTQNINAFFHSLRGNQVGSDSSFNYYFQSQNFADASRPAPLSRAVFAQQKEQTKAASSDTAVRRDFKDTILWLPYLLTDVNGQASVDVHYPDNLTTWRTTARGIAATSKMGQTTISTQTTKDLIARLSLPRFLVNGDTATLATIVNNNSTEKTSGQVGMQLKNLNTKDKLQNNFELEAGGRSRNDVRVRANNFFGTALVQASATSNTDNDALELPLNVKPRGYTQSDGWAGGPESRAFEISEDANLQNAKLRLFVTPNLTAAVTPALEYLVGYPYGCSEQTMSKFLPTLLAKQTLGANSLPMGTAKELPKMIEAGLNRLTNFQHEDGGWGFWENDDSTLEMSSYILRGLTRAKNLGYASGADTLKNAVNYLRQNVRNSKEPLGVQASAYRALAVAGQPDVAGMNFLAKRKNLNAYATANLALAYKQMGQPSKAQEMLNKLKNLSRKQGRGLVYWSGNHKYSWWYYWEDDDVEVTATALEALARIEPTSPLIPQVSVWLLRKREGGMWYSTKDTATTIEAALALNETRNPSQPKIRIELNDQTISESELNFNARTYSYQLPKEFLKIGQNVLKISGDKNLIYSVELSYVRQPKSLTATSKGGLIVSRQYQKLEPQWNEKEQRYTYKRSNILHNGTLDPIKVGDLILVTLQVDARGQDPMRYLMVQDPIPAGMRALDERNFAVTGTDWGTEDYYDWGYWYSGRELRDDRVDIYAEYLWGNSQKVQYVMRAETPGQFTALPTQAFLMYDPSVEGRSNALRLTVQDSGK